MDEITARIMVAVETGNAIRNIDNLRAQIDKLTAAGQRNIKISMPNVKIVQPRPYPQGVINRPKDSGDGSGPTRLNKEAIKEEIAASTRALQKQRAVRRNEQGRCDVGIFTLCHCYAEPV